MDACANFAVKVNSVVASHDFPYNLRRIMELSQSMTQPLLSTPARGLALLAVCFLGVSVSIETVYSWRSLGDAYYLIKVAGWFLLAWGAVRLRAKHDSGLVLSAAGWAWMAANFGRAVADRLTKIGAGETLRLGSVELAFAGSCLIVCLGGLSWSLARACRTATLKPVSSEVPQ